MLLNLLEKDEKSGIFGNSTSILHGVTMTFLIHKSSACDLLILAMIKVIKNSKATKPTALYYWNLWH
ncbi:MAG: hypothetical protein MSS67_00895 [Helicobacter bilis]|nr:hypothetical protein [Helicobacter bilis]MDY4399308.1 hypothetical protein [Helicobacter bilis]